MRYFALLLDSESRGIPDQTRRAYEILPRSRALGFRWQSFNHAAVLTAWDDDYADSLLAAQDGHLAVGFVRLDNRADLERWSGASGLGLTDLELVLRTVVQHGRKYIPQFLGDFGFVVWSATSRTAVAACDVFAVKKLYYAEHSGLVAFASRAEALASDDCYEPEYLAQLIANCSPTPGLTVYAGVRSVPEGCIAIVERGRLTTSRYWSAHEFAPQSSWASAERLAAETCRELFAESVRLRLTGNGETWAQLSGGIDSSSVVSMAQWLAKNRKSGQELAGTVTYVERQGTQSDERAYSDHIVRRWGVRNETIVDSPLWYDGDHPPPRTDQPRMEYPFYPQERTLCSIVRNAGGRVILTGVGGDEVFGGYMLYVADWLARGRIWSALRETVLRAAVGRVSFWRIAYHDVLLPLLPGLVHSSLMRARGTVPIWVTEEATRRYDLRSHTFAALFGGGRLGHKCQHATSALITSIGRLMEPGVVGEALEIRHPFLYRPLVEFALALPSELSARPYQRKWVLREAMRGILPDVVRTRIGKGSPADLYAWSLTALRPLLEPLVHESMMADLGIIDATRLAVAFDLAPQHPGTIYQDHALIYTALAIEAWLQARSGRWPRGGHRGLSTSLKVHHPQIEGNRRSSI